MNCEAVSKMKELVLDSLQNNHSKSIDFEKESHKLKDEINFLHSEIDKLKR